MTRSLSIRQKGQSMASSLCVAFSLFGERIAYPKKTEPKQTSRREKIFSLPSRDGLFRICESSGVTAMRGIANLAHEASA